MKKLLVILFVLCAALPFVACKSKSSLVAVTNISFYEKEIRLGVGESTQLQYKIFPANATNKNVQFFSSDPSAVSVTEDGVATLNRNQSATVTVRSTDGITGGFVATCKIIPIIPPKEILLNDSALEEKIGETQTNKYLMLSIGQTKVLPIITDTESVFTDGLSVSVVRGNSVEVIKSAEWLLRGKMVGDSVVVVKSIYDDSISCEFNVRVQSTADNVVVKKITKSENQETSYEPDGGKVVKVSDNVYRASFGFTSLENNSYLAVSLMSGGSFLQNIMFSAMASDADVFDFDIVDDSEHLVNLQNFNECKYIKIIPKINTNATLCLLSNAIASNGEPIQVLVDISISDTPNEVDVFASGLNRTTATEAKAAIIGEAFSVDIVAYKKGNDNVRTQVPLGNRRIFYEVSDQAKIRPIAGLTNGALRTETNGFVALDVAGSVTIYVYVSKENTKNANDISKETSIEEINEHYVVGEITISVQKQPMGLYIEFSNSVLSSGDSIVFVDGLNQEIDLVKGIVCKDLSVIVEQEDFVWRFEIESNSLAVEVDNGKLVARALGKSAVTIRFDNGVEKFEKTINIYVQV